MLNPGSEAGTGTPISLFETGQDSFANLKIINFGKYSDKDLISINFQYYTKKLYPDKDAFCLILAVILDSRQRGLMPGLKVLFSQTYDPWFNLATEDWIFKEWIQKVRCCFSGETRKQ